MAAAYLLDVQQIAVRDWKAGQSKGFKAALRRFDWSDQSTWKPLVRVARRGIQVVDDCQVAAASLIPPPMFVQANQKLIAAYAAAYELERSLVQGLESSSAPDAIFGHLQTNESKLHRANRGFVLALRVAAKKTGVAIPPNIIRAYPSN